ncbi:MAG: MarR family transcriptional regulator [Rhodospirillales bacterium]|nr:MarR family transcriptional regulator [Rhodospirillales bacterium]
MSKLIPDCIPPQPSAEFSAIVREKRNNSIGYLITLAQRLMHKGLGMKFQAHGVSVAQWSVLVTLWEVDGLTQKELSERVTVETATLSRTIDRMERDGLVKRVRSASDRRQVHVFLSDYGAGLWRKLVPEAETMLTLALAGISEEEEQTLRQLLKRVINNVQNCPCQNFDQDTSPTPSDEQ